MKHIHVYFFLREILLEAFTSQGVGGEKKKVKYTEKNKGTCMYSCTAKINIMQVYEHYGNVHSIQQQTKRQILYSRTMNVCTLAKHASGRSRSVMDH